MMEYEEDLMTTQFDDYEDDADDATEMQLPPLFTPLALLAANNFLVQLQSNA